MKLKKFIAGLVSGVMMVSFAGIMPEKQSAPETITAQAAASDFTQAQAVQWMQDRVNEGWCVDVDGAAGCQCVDLLQAYGTYLGVYVPSLNAFQYASWGLPDGWTRVYSDPQPGDMFVQNPGVGGADATYGHVGLIMAVNGGTVTTAETNYWTAHYGNPNCRSVTRDASTFSSFIRPNFGNAAPQGHVMSEEEAGGQTIPDGDYWIASGLSYNYFLDVPGEELSPEGTTVLMQVNEKGMPSEFDVWTVTYLNNGFYQIRQKNGLPLDAHGGTIDEGLNANLWTRNDSEYGSPAQQWSISRDENGYCIRARCNACCLDVEKALIEHGTNVGTYFYNGGLNQYWCFIPYAPDERPLEDGVYRISSKYNSALVLDAAGTAAEEPYVSNTNVQVWDTGGDDYFRIAYDQDGYYHVYENTSGLALDVYNADADYTTGKTIQLHEADATKRNQLWKLRETDDGTYMLYSKLNGFVMDVSMPDGKEPENGTNVGTYTPKMSNNTNQQWLFAPYEEPTEPTTEEPTTTTEVPTTDLPTESVTTTQEFISLSLGDTTDDGEIDIMDVIAVNKYLLGTGKLTNTGRKNADVDGNGEINSTDSLNILKYVVEILTSFDEL